MHRTISWNSVVSTFIRPPGTTVPDGLMFYAWCIFFFFFCFATGSPSSLDRSPCNFATWSESGWIYSNPKIRGGGRFPKKLGGTKTCKIWVNFGPLQILISNISATADDIQNPPTLQTMAIPPAFNEKSPVNFVPLTAWNYMWVWTH